MGSSPGFIRLAALLVAVLVPASVSGQVSGRTALGGFVGGSLGDGGATGAVGVSGVVPVSAALSVEVDASYLPRLDFGEIPVCPPDVFCILTGVSTVRGGSYSVHGRSRSVAVSLVSRLPVSLGTMQPYVAAGGGVANVRRELRDTQLPLSFSRTSTDPLITIGGGVDVPMTRRIMFGVDARYERAFGDDQFGRDDVAADLSLTRITLVVRYRF
jgi:Outer membrane protein beta-barrel domain